MDYQKKVDEIKRTISSLKKDLRRREEQSKAGETTYSIDADIRGGFSDLEQQLSSLSSIVSTYTSGSGLPPKEVEKRRGTYSDLMSERDDLKRWFDSFFEKKTISAPYSGADKQTKFTDKYDTTNLNAKQLNQLRTHENNLQEEALDGLITAVQGIKHTGLAMNKEFTEQEQMLNELENHVDDNTAGMSKVRGKMLKLLEESSNWCLGLTIVGEIAAIICIFVFWH